MVANDQIRNQWFRLKKSVDIKIIANREEIVYDGDAIDFNGP